jgi:hypothetical protein
MITLPQSAIPKCRASIHDGRYACASRQISRPFKKKFKVKAFYIYKPSAKESMRGNLKISTLTRTVLFRVLVVYFSSVKRRTSKIRIFTDLDKNSLPISPNYWVLTVFLWQLRHQKWRLHTWPVSQRLTFSHLCKCTAVIPNVHVSED